MSDGWPKKMADANQKQVSENFDPAKLKSNQDKSKVEPWDATPGNKIGEPYVDPMPHVGIDVNTIPRLTPMQQWVLISIKQGRHRNDVVKELREWGGMGCSIFRAQERYDGAIQKGIKEMFKGWLTGRVKLTSGGLPIGWLI